MPILTQQLKYSTLFINTMLQAVISKDFKLISKIGINPFYQVFKAINIKNETTVAVKVQARSVSESKLYNEAKVIKEIQGQDSITDLGIPQIIQMGSEDTFNYMMVNFLGPSLDLYMMNNGGRIGHKLALDFAVQMIERIQMVHSKGYIHRDLRPQHFLYGRQKRPNKLYLTGLCLGKKYIRIDKKHSPYKDNKLGFSGTARYSSINTMLGIEQSRRDDIEAIIYILIYLMKGYLPWQGIKGYDRKEKTERILVSKMITPISILCKDLPTEIAAILEQTRILQYEQEPNYEDLKKKFITAAANLKQELIFQ